jgi:hypothetical protein
MYTKPVQVQKIVEDQVEEEEEEKTIQNRENKGNRILFRNSTPFPAIETVS